MTSPLRQAATEAREAMADLLSACNAVCERRQVVDPHSMRRANAALADLTSALAAGDGGEGHRANFVKQHYGATVATIRETPDECLEVQALSGGTFSLTVYSRQGESDRWDDLSIELERKHFGMLGSIAAAPPPAVEGE
jgi:hypothetical protein